MRESTGKRFSIVVCFEFRGLGFGGCRSFHQMSNQAPCRLQRRGAARRCCGHRQGEVLRFALRESLYKGEREREREREIKGYTGLYRV